MIKTTLNWALDFMNTAHTILDVLGKASEKIPDSIKQRLPGFLGISLEDERLFNGVLGQLTPDKQIVITNFLFACQDFQRIRFINIVAGMEVIKEKTTKKDEKNKKEETTENGTRKDYRKEFLDSFASVITEKFADDFTKAFNYCIAGRLIMPDRALQPVFDAWQKSCILFNDFILKPSGVSSIKELAEKVKDNIINGAANLNLMSESMAEKINNSHEAYKKKPFWRKIIFN